MAKHIYIYSISKGYTKLTIWVGTPAMKNRVGVITVTPGKDLTRKEKYDAIGATLYKGYGIVAPCYKPLKGERV